MGRHLLHLIPGLILLLNSVSLGAAEPPLHPSSLLRIQSPDGVIDIQLHQAAAPDAVRQLRRLVEGPIFAPDIRSGGPQVEGYYDGLSFDHAIPGHEIATSIRPPARAILIPTQIDATALGLDRKFLSNAGEAMNVWQFEVMPEITRLKGPPKAGTALAEWLQLWRNTGKADFLLKLSQKEINEGLGFRYQEGLASLPVRRGTVGLQAFDRKNSTPRLIIHLNDRPDLDGRQMIVGRVIHGMETCDSISRRPLTPIHSEEFRPLVPEPILKAELVSLNPPSAQPKEEAHE